MLSNKKLDSKVIELFIGGRKLNISLVSFMQPYFKAPKDVRLNTAYFFIINIPKRQKLEQIAYNHL